MSSEAAPTAQSGYVPVNGLDMYYEVQGTRDPLVLIHGAFSAIGKSFQHVLPGLAKSRQVIALEMQAHGRTADIDRPLTYEQMADDTAAALRHLGVERADFFGYSAPSSACRSPCGTPRRSASSSSCRPPTPSTASTRA